MREMMLDLETLDVRVSAVVLSVGAVVWRTERNDNGVLSYVIEDRFLRKLDLDEQLSKGRSVKQDTLLWWMRQDPTAKAEAFDPIRQSVASVLDEFHGWATGRMNKIDWFWASPATFDFPIIETLAEQFDSPVPWAYWQKYDVRTAANEASYSVKDHAAEIGRNGVPHMPVYDCEWQIGILTAARNWHARKIT